MNLKGAENKQTIGGALMKEVSNNPTQITPTTPETETNSHKMTGVSACHFVKMFLRHMSSNKSDIKSKNTPSPRTSPM